MNDNNSLISLTCPNCQATLSCSSTEMTITCEHCGTSVLIKDFITKSRVNNDDKLQSYLTLAENAFKIKDWKNAYKYYESICKITKSDKDITIFNALGYICGKIGFRDGIAVDCRKLELDMRILLLNEMKKYTESLKAHDMEIVRNLPNDSKNKKTNYPTTLDITIKYQQPLKTLNSEIEATKPIKCMCGNFLQCTDEECSKCGKSRQEVLEYIKDKKTFTNSLICMFFSVIFGALAVSDRLKIFNYIVAFIFLLISVMGLNRTSKTEALKNKVKKLFLPITIGFPIVFMILIGLCIKPSKADRQCKFSFQKTDTIEISDSDESSYFIIDSYKNEYEISDLEFISENPSIATFSYKRTALGNYIYYNIEPVSKGETDVYVKCNDCEAISQKIHVVVDLEETIPITNNEKETEIISTEPATEEKNDKATEVPTEEKTEKATEPPTDEPAEEETEPEVITHDYVINYNTGKFHRPSCYTIKDADNLGDYNGTKDELIDQGYVACKKCKPY